MDTLLEIENYTYTIALAPIPATLRAWAKLREVERRIFYLKDAMSKNRPIKPLTTFISDAASSFLMTFEATIQICGEEFIHQRSEGAWDMWQKNSAELAYLIVRGLRTLRHLEAHVVSRRAKRLTIAKLGMELPNVSDYHYFDMLNEPTLRMLKRPKIDQNELPNWNSFIEQHTIVKVCEDGLRKLAHFISVTEQELYP